MRRRPGRSRVTYRTTSARRARLNPDVTQENIAQTVCVPGYTKTIRPPPSYTNRLKARQMRELHLPGTAHDYHEDHLIPLCAGGHPSDERNLWPEPVDGQWSARVKDQLESSVWRQVCHGDMTLEQGRAIFLAPDWTREYVKYFGPDMRPQRWPFWLISRRPTAAFGP